MRKHFPGYYRPTESEFLDLWDKCIFTLDANVLLDLYRYTPETSNELINILSQAKTRIWIPNQVSLEYLKERINVITKQGLAYSEIQDLLCSTRDNLKGRLGEYSRHPFINIKQINGKVDQLCTKIIEDLNKKSEEHPDLLKEDSIWSRVTDLYNGRVGEPFPPEKKAEIIKEGSKRYDNEIPTGYRDKNKPEGERYGDLLIWFQMMDKAKEAKKPVIFVTDDNKEDWWQIFRGKTIGPRPELVNEFFAYTGQRFYIYSPVQFMEYARQYLKRKIEQKTIDEVREVSRRKKEYELYDKYLYKLDWPKKPTLLENKLRELVHNRNILRRRMIGLELQLPEIESEEEKKSVIKEIERYKRRIQQKSRVIDLIYNDYLVYKQELLRDTSEDEGEEPEDLVQEFIDKEESTTED